jgi:ribosomal protein RSM22 (predicted rRNA methylase)
MPNRLARFEVLENLWSKIKDEGYLVLSEHGSKHGFMLINEAREFMLTVKLFIFNL